VTLASLREKKTEERFSAVVPQIANRAKPSGARATASLTRCVRAQMAAPFAAGGLSALLRSQLNGDESGHNELDIRDGIRLLPLSNESRQSCSLCAWTLQRKRATNFR
jgi:hypothetical protein